MPLIDTSSLTPLSLSDNLQTYCGLDCCVTLEVWQELQKLFNKPPEIYSFERALQGPYLEIMQRGFAVDQQARAHAAADLRERLTSLYIKLNVLAQAVWSKPLNPRSPQQVRDFFYGAMRLPEVWLSQKGQRKLSTNREALEKLETYFYARPIISTILAIRDLSKQLEVFETEIDSDGRFRTSYNIAGTETGRPSSSSNAFGTGGNLQNISPGLRWPFVADPGYKLFQIDFEQVEARDVGYFIGCLFDDWSFLDSCESGDLHTANARLVWPELDWTGDIKKDKDLAESPFYRTFSYRDMAKRGGHLSNYMGTAYTASRWLKVPLRVMEDFQARYCRGDPSRGIVPAHPGIPRYWQWIAQEIQTTHRLVTPFGRERQFFGRPGDDATIREGIAFMPQSTTAERTNLGLWRVWRYEPEIKLLGQTYDSICGQFPEGKDFLIGRALEHMRIVLERPDGSPYVVPAEAKVGWNWGYRVTNVDQQRARKAGKPVPRLNPDGLVKWPGDDRQQRQRRLDRSMGD